MRPITTQYGELIPQHTTDDLRKKEILPVTLHANGMHKSIPLEKETTITTPVGDISAELVTFHDNGTLNRIFPLNGKLSGYWGEADELELAKPITLRTSAGDITAKIISISFYDNETLRSLTFWPGEVVDVLTPAGPMKVHTGLSFSLNGALRSLEPASPTPISTIIGDITAFDPDAMGVNGDINSLVFDSHGNVKQVTTTLSRISVIHPDGQAILYKPLFRESYCSETEQEPIPMVIKIEEHTISICTHSDHPPTCIPIADHVFFSESHLPQLETGIAHMACGL